MTKVETAILMVSIGAAVIALGAAVSQYFMWRRDSHPRLRVRVSPYGEDERSRAIFVEVVNLSSFPVPIASLVLKAEGDILEDLPANLVVLPLSAPPVTIPAREGHFRFLSNDELRGFFAGDVPTGRTCATVKTITGKEFSHEVDLGNPVGRRSLLDRLTSGVSALKKN